MPKQVLEPHQVEVDGMDGPQVQQLEDLGARQLVLLQESDALEKAQRLLRAQVWP